MAKGDAKIFMLSGDLEELKVLWNAVKKDLLADWIKKKPCLRPWVWWTLDAPRWERKFDAWFDGTLQEPRRRLGGIGTPNFEELAYFPHFSYGIPTGWVTKFQQEYYNGRALDIHGNIISSEYTEGDFKGVAINSEDPPCFESVAVYLERHGLLTPTEKVYLKKHQELLEPEKIELEENEEG